MAEVDVSSDVHGRKGPVVDVGSIEKELAELWRMPTFVGLRETDIVPTRTSVLNLVVNSSDPSLAERTSTIIGDLAANHPSRVISFIATAEPGAFEDDIDAHVSTHCHTASGERFASCYELIEIKTPPDSLDEMPSLIVALAIPDLPTFVWWPGQPPLADRRFAPVALAANRLIVDSIDFQEVGPSLAQLFELCLSTGHQCVLSDLNWARLTPWRSMLSQFFDIPDCRWALDYLSELRLEFGHAGDGRMNAAQALLVVGWLASRLGWSVSEGNNSRINDRHGRQISVTITEHPCPSAFNGCLFNASLAATNGSTSGTFEITRVGEDLTTLKMTASIDGHVVAEHAMHDGPAKLPQLLIRELENTQLDDLYHEAVSETQRFASFFKVGGGS